jgi:inorganic pyrophosphatase
MTPPADFWRALEALAAACPLVVDRPRGSAHPRYPQAIYPLDYGYLDGTRGGDGAGLDAWRGSLPEAALTAILCTVDLRQREAEIKLLLGCTPAEAQLALHFHNSGSQSAILIERPPHV